MSPPATQNQEPAGLTACPTGYRHPNCDPQGECLGDWEPRGFYWGWGQGWGLHLGVPSPCYCRVSRQDHADPDVPSPAAAPGGDTAEEPAPDPAGDRDPVVTLPLSMTPHCHLCPFPRWEPHCHPCPLPQWGPHCHPCPLLSQGPHCHPRLFAPEMGTPRSPLPAKPPSPGVPSPGQAVPGLPTNPSPLGLCPSQSQPTLVPSQPIPF